MKYYCDTKQDSVIEFAVSELKKYLYRMNGTLLEQTACSEEADFLIGIPEMPYHKWDDGIMLRSSGKQLILTGTNSRSVLFAIYEFLKYSGCRWLAPGIEIVPAVDKIRLDGFDFIEHAASRYRGYAICDAGNKEEEMPYMRDFIDWMLKQKCNLYFSEGFPLDCPGDEWSIKDGIRPLQHIESFCGKWSIAEREARIARREELISFARSRGLLIERYGHGWAAGIVEHIATLRGISLEEARTLLKAKGRISQEAGELGNSSMWFQFCMSIPELKDIYVSHAVNYLKEHHQDTDIAAFWLGDGYDNACLCPQCIEKPFSEWYMEIFDEIVRQTSRFAPELRFEGLIYFMTMEPPQSHWLQGWDNVDFIIAPWNRCYRHRNDDPECCYPEWKPDFRNNASYDFEHHHRPLNNDVGEAIRAWKEKVEHFHPRMFEYYSLSLAPGKHRLSYNASDLARDIRDFKRLGIEGSVSCEYSFIDSPFFLTHQIATALMWNPETDENKLRTEWICTFYGEDGNVLIGVADKVNTLLYQWDEHSQTAPDIKHKIVCGLKEIFIEMVDKFPAVAFDILATAGFLSIDSEYETEVLEKLLDSLKKYPDAIGKLADCKNLERCYQHRLDELRKKEH